MGSSGGGLLTLSWKRKTVMALNIISKLKIALGVVHKILVESMERTHISALHKQKLV